LLSLNNLKYMKNTTINENHHSTAVIENGAEVAGDANLGCFVQICPTASVGNNAVVAGLVIVPPNVHIGANSRIGAGVCFVTPVLGEKPTFIGDGATIGEHAIISAGVSIGDGAVIAPLTLIQRSIPAMAIVEGSPARIVGYVGASSNAIADNLSVNEPIQRSNVSGVKLHHMQCVADIRGNLTVGEFDRSIPFQPKRYFIVYDVPSMETRGEHAHRACHQFLICVRGSCAVVVDDGQCRQEFLLDRPDMGLHLPPMIWGIQYKYSADAVLLVYASHYYDSADYIRDYAEFRQLVGAKK
jgi:UDP-2-acetamido-3-amino-2,3-dideoxy-glucuronate N-acetyltransferase